MLHIGIDEAGYGPLLGPLVIGAAVFRVDPDVAPPDPWQENLRARLKGIVTSAACARQPVGRRLPVPVDDSKRIRQRFGLPGLARGVGIFAAAMDQAPPADLEDLLARYSDRQPDDYAGVPWFRDLAGAPLPHYPWTGPLDERVAARGVQALDLRVLPADAPELNDSFERLRNKAGVLGLLTADLLLSILDRHPGEDALAILDRHGARLDYGPYLARVFPFARVTQRTAPPDEARYRIDLPDRRLRLRFATKGDRRSLAVGWASVAAKLTRDLFMQRLNAWFEARLPALRPTAGYHQDGRRFLDDVDSVLDGEAINRSLLVRSR